MSSLRYQVNRAARCLPHSHAARASLGACSARSVSVITNQLRVGQVIDKDGKLWEVKTMKHVKPGKGGAFNQIELKELMGGTKKTERFRSSETVELAHIDKEEQLDFLYRDGGLLALMNPQTFEQIEVPVDMLSADHQRLLQEGMPVAVEKYQGRPLFARIPKDVTVQVTDTKTHVKGVSVNAGFKPATVTGGAMVKVPPYIAAGDNIVINTTDMSFVRRTSE